MHCVQCEGGRAGGQLSNYRIALRLSSIRKTKFVVSQNLQKERELNKALYGSLRLLE